MRSFSLPVRTLATISSGISMPQCHCLGFDIKCCGCAGKCGVCQHAPPKTHPDAQLGRHGLQLVNACLITVGTSSGAVFSSTLKRSTSFVLKMHFRVPPGRPMNHRMAQVWRKGLSLSQVLRKMPAQTTTKCSMCSANFTVRLNHWRTLRLNPKTLLCPFREETVVGVVVVHRTGGAFVL